MVYKDMLWSCAGFPGLLRARGVPLPRRRRLLAAFQYTGSHISRSATPREMDWAEFRAQQERLNALRAEPVPAIIIAARDGDVDALRRELDLGVSVDLADAWKSTPLQVACGAKEVSEETGLLGIARIPTYGKSRPRAAGKPTKKRTAQNSSRPSCRNLRTSFRKSSCR